MRRGIRLVSNGDGSHRLELGTIISALVVAGVLAIGGSLVSVSLLTWRTTQTEDQVEAMARCLGRQARNQLRLDERQRIIRKDVRWANNKLDAVLTKMKISDRVEEPALPDSVLEPVPDGAIN